ncbi:ras and Rab interactor 1-like [Corythoichthys intestinalis]|uniref:ras and Rab interactor 1-like n=1 Tax=Corythoichthys intestinalis TaxID=161448 RepID=UPI0025A4F67A|nr:ras and Rab interactor 1-like [Corythoichthys intestinalis]XP_057677486.1 ras and Rab interactor 1-like [Corythoichthys intestinalis]XP_057677487.1 ras and Rab interactor 1-like [Corythoichthys intestinalis]
MAKPEEPLYDFPEPTQESEHKFAGHQRGGSLRNVSVLDRLLLTVPVWLQLSINPATALHILQREPPGTFLVRKSRTSQTNVLCVRLVDDSVPSFVQQFGIREEHSTLSLETSAISFPDLPRLVSFYCVSRDVLPFPLELPEAIAKATSHKELESISHMGIEFWSSHLNVRGPREPPKTQMNKEPTPNSSVSAANPQTASSAPPATQTDSANQTTNSECDQKSDPNSALFREFCPIETRSPRELDCGLGLGALCFINPLFLQSDSILSKRRLMKRSFKVRVSTETSTLMLPPLAPPPPPPLMPKTSRRCKAWKKTTPASKDSQSSHPSSVMEEEVKAQLPSLMEHTSDDLDYMKPSSAITSSVSPGPDDSAPPLPPKLSPCSHNPPTASPPPPSQYQYPSLSPRAPFTLSASPYQSPSFSPKVPFSLSPFFSNSLAQLVETSQTPEDEFREEEGVPVNQDNGVEDLRKEMEVALLDDTESCGS